MLHAMNLLAYFLVVITAGSSCNLGSECGPLNMRTEIAGTSLVSFSCPTDAGEYIPTGSSVTWFIARDTSEPQELNISADSSLSIRESDNLIIDLRNISTRHEGRYSCRLPSTSVNLAKCLCVLGRGDFACRADDSCIENYTATEGGNITLNASVAFVQGGHQNQNFTRLLLSRVDSSGTPIYDCKRPTGAESCLDSERVKVFFRQNSDNEIDIRLTWTNLSQEDSGDYLLEMKVKDMRDGMETEGTRSLAVHLNINGMMTTELTESTSPSLDPQTDTESPAETTMKSTSTSVGLGSNTMISIIVVGAVSTLLLIVFIVFIILLIAKPILRLLHRPISSGKNDIESPPSTENTSAENMSTDTIIAENQDTVKINSLSTKEQDKFNDIILNDKDVLKSVVILVPSSSKPSSPFHSGIVVESGPKRNRRDSTVSDIEDYKNVHLSDDIQLSSHLSHV